MAEPSYLEKVTAFITRPGRQETEMLLFAHPHAGIQFPAGTVEEGETLEEAVLRETAEETGLTDTRILLHLGWREELPPDSTHVILRTTPVFVRPDSSSADWARLRRGYGVRLLRHERGYAQVTYEEWDRYPNPTHITFQVTGWVPETNLAAANRRHFFHLEASPNGPPEWSQFSDYNNFRLFWAPLSTLAGLALVQRNWLDYVLQDLSYSF